MIRAVIEIVLNNTAMTDYKELEEFISAVLILIYI